MHRKRQSPDRTLILLARLVMIVVFLSVLPLFSQESKEAPFDPGKTFPIEKLREDLGVFRLALEEGHAGLYRYTSKQELDSHFEGIAKKLDHPLTESEFYRLLAPLIASICDGHTRVSFSTPYENYLQEKPWLFPFNLRIIGGKTYLFKDFSEKGDFIRGSELLSINGQPISEILDLMLPFIPRDAHVQTSRYRRMERTAYFGSLLNFLFGPTASYTITYKEPASQEIKKITVKGIKAKDLTGIHAGRYPDEARELPPIQLEFKGGVAVLTVRTFGSGAFKNANISYPTFLRNAFIEFEEKGVQNLIIDLRDNGGGDDAYGKILFAHLIDKPFRYYEHLRVNRAEFSFFEYTDIPPEQRNFQQQLKKNEAGTYDLIFHPNLGEQKPIPPIFKGKVYILINGNSFSGTGECTSLIHYHQKAVFIGEECGAGYYGNTSGFMPLVTLPHTKIRARIPMVLYTMAVTGYPEDRGIVPEHLVEPTIEDLLSGKDTAMEYTLKKVILGDVP